MTVERETERMGEERVTERMGDHEPPTNSPSRRPGETERMGDHEPPTNSPSRRPGETERTGKHEPPTNSPSRRPGETERTGKHWFEGVADTLGASYLKYSFTRGTNQEVDALIDMLEIDASHRILDVGCGPGRHAVALGKRGHRVHGIDISERFIEIARAGADAAGVADRVTFEVADARTWGADQPFDRLISLCQGAFGLAAGPGSGDSLDPDLSLFANVAKALAPSGRLAMSAFSAYFQVRMLDAETDSFDAARGVNHEHTVIKDEAGADHPAELWTTCVTPRELRLMAASVGLAVEAIHSVRPGAYLDVAPNIDSEEFLLIAAKP